MEEKSHQCYNCKHFIRYYIKGIKRFSKTKFGRCCRGHGQVELHDSCEKYVFQSRKSLMPQFVQIALNDLLTEISVIRNIIEDEVYNEEL